MFLWKNAIVLLGLLGMATFLASMLARAAWEKAYVARLAGCGALIACVAVSAAPMLPSQILFLLLMLFCFDRRVPMAATYLFFLYWTPAAGSLLSIGGAYIAPLTPFAAFSAAILIGYVVHPEQHLRRRFTLTDALMLGFVLIYCICVSIRDTPTGVARNFATYFVPYVFSYMVLSRAKIDKPEMLLRLMVYGAAAAALLCLFETVRHWPLYAGVWSIKHESWLIDAPRVWLERGGFARAYGPFAHPLTGGTMLGIAGIAAWGLMLMRGRSTPLLGLVLIVLLGTLATVSRSGFIALGVGLFTFQMLRRRYGLGALTIILGLVFIVGVPMLGGEDQHATAIYRLDILQGVPAALGNRIWFGYREAVAQGLLDAFIQGQGIVDIVNAYLAIIVMGGVVSVVFYILFLLSTFPHYRAIRRAGPEPAELLLAQTLVSIQAGIIVSITFLASWAAPMQLSFIIAAMLIALRTSVAARGRSGSKRAPAPLASHIVAPEMPALPPVGEGTLPVLR